MARKIIVNAGDAIGSLVSKNNQMSNYLGDLDLLDSHFATSQLVDAGKFDDSSFVKAINHLHYELDSINSYLTGGTASLTVDFIRGDSARFTNLSVGSITIDSATIDSAFVGLLRGNVLDYNSATIDSARITNLSGRNLNFDSADIISLRSEETFGDSARITNISGSGLINYASGNFATIVSDSIGFGTVSMNTLTANTIAVSNDVVIGGTVTATNVVVNDSAYVGGTLTATTVDVDTTFRMDNLDMIDAKLFTIKDSTGSNLLAGYLLSTSATVGIA
tara:strand:+ start:396 stop:1229 length:834 start_codon:yes stop_codon:yes gene_type:complete